MGSGTKCQRLSNPSISQQAAIASWLRNTRYFAKCCWFSWNICSCCQTTPRMCLTDPWAFLQCNCHYWSLQMVLLPQTMGCSHSLCQNRIPEDWALQKQLQFVLVLSKLRVQKPSAKRRTLRAIIQIHDMNRVFLKSPSELQRSTRAWNLTFIN